MIPIILASTSPRRSQILKLYGLSFKAVDSGYREVLHKHLKPKDLVKFLALGKARASAKKYRKAIIISADTVVSYNGVVFGKPKNRQEAFKFLKSLSGKKHYVYTGVAVLNSQTGEIFQAVSKEAVWARTLTDLAINSYLNLNQYKGRAGAYSPQGPGLNIVKKIKGDMTGIIGLPVGLVIKGMNKLRIKF